MAQLHVCLLEHYEQENVQIWNMTSKTHYCLHTFYLARWLHPSLTWAFKGESTMKAVQTLWKSCLSGNKHWAVCKIAAFKMRHLMHLKDETAWKKLHYFWTLLVRITCDIYLDVNLVSNSLLISVNIFTQREHYHWKNKQKFSKCFHLFTWELHVNIWK